MRKLLAEHLRATHKFPVHRALLLAYRIEQGEELSAEDLAFFKLDTPPPSRPPSPEPVTAAVVQPSALEEPAPMDTPTKPGATPGCAWCRMAKKPPCAKCRDKAARVVAAGAIAIAAGSVPASPAPVVILENKTAAPLEPGQVVALPTPADVEKRARALLRERLVEDREDLLAQLKLVDRYIAELA